MYVLSCTFRFQMWYVCVCDRVVVKVFDSKVNVIYNCRIVGDSVGHMFGSGSRSGC